MNRFIDYTAWAMMVISVLLMCYIVGEMQRTGKEIDRIINNDPIILHEIQ